MISLNQIIAQKQYSKIKALLAACEAYDFDSSNDDGVIHQMMHQLRNFGFFQKDEKKDGVYTYGYRLSSNRSSHHRQEPGGSGEGNQEC